MSLTKEQKLINAVVEAATNLAADWDQGMTARAMLRDALIQRCVGAALLPPMPLVTDTGASPVWAKSHLSTTGTSKAHVVRWIKDSDDPIALCQKRIYLTRHIISPNELKALDKRGRICNRCRKILNV